MEELSYAFDFLRAVYLFNQSNCSHPALEEVYLLLSQIEWKPSIRGSVLCCFHLLYHLLPLVVTHCHLLSLVVICCHSLYHSLSLVVLLFVIRCHSLSFVFTLCSTSCHSLSPDLSLVGLFYKQSFLSVSSIKYLFVFFVIVIFIWLSKRIDNVFYITRFMANDICTKMIKWISVTKIIRIIRVFINSTALINSIILLMN